MHCREEAGGRDERLVVMITCFKDSPAVVIVAIRDMFNLGA